MGNKKICNSRSGNSGNPDSENQEKPEIPKNNHVVYQIKAHSLLINRVIKNRISGFGKSGNLEKSFNIWHLVGSGLVPGSCLPRHFSGIPVPDLENPDPENPEELEIQKEII